MPEISDRERDCLQHALGLNRARNPYRNMFMAEPGSPDDLVFQELQRRGLARLHSGPRPGLYPDNSWRVTEAGARAAGATDDQARRIAA